MPVVTTKKGTVGSAMKKVKSGDDSKSGDSDSSDDDVSLLLFDSVLYLFIFNESSVFSLLAYLLLFYP